MRILVSGASGLIGSALVRRLSGLGHEVVRLVRSHAQPGAGEVSWDPMAGRIDRADLEAAPVEAVVHLAGENLAKGRWTAHRKALIRDSRVEGTRLLAQTLATLPARPRVFCSASAVGFYGNRGDEELTEDSVSGTGFLAEVCRDWEAATSPAAEAGIRVVRMRLGVVLDRSGGVLAKMLPMFRLGLGGRLGSGRQYLSWITLHDAVEAIRSLLAGLTLQGAVNLVTPTPVTNRQFTAALGRVLRRPALVPAPAAMLRLLLGEMAGELLLSSARVLPRRLVDAGFTFRDSELDAALHRLFGAA